MLEYFIRSQMESRGYVPIKKDDLERERDIWQEEREEFLQACDNLREKLEKSNVELESLRQECEVLSGERESLRGEVKVLNRDHEGLLQERDDFRQELEVTKQEKGSLLSAQESLKEKLKTSNVELESLREECEGTLRERDTLRGELNVLGQDRERLSEKLVSLQHDKFNALLRSPEEVARFVNTTVQGVLRKHHRSVFWGDRLMSMDKTAGFWENKKFSEFYRQIRDSHVYDQYSGPDGIAWRLHTLVWAARSAMKLPGDFIECGVFKGDMSWVLANTVDFADINKDFYLYDTFEGFSDKYSSADDFPFNPNFLDFANKAYKIPDLHKKVEGRFKDFQNIKVIKGVLPDVLDKVAPDRISFLHIDLNSPTAEVAVLDILFDRVVSGGMVVFDDYGWFEYINQKRAEDAFMNDRGYTILELPTGQGLVVKR